MAEDYCEMCDLPLSQCVHGMPAPPPAPTPAPRSPVVRSVRTPAARSSSGSASSRATAGGTTTTRRAPSLVTDRAAFRPHIVRILRVEGTLETEDMLLELEMAMEDVLRDRDRATSPTGEIRWHTAARAERKALINEGLMVEGRPGVWELTAAGRAAQQL